MSDTYGTQNEDIGSAFNNKEMDILLADGAYCHENGYRRASNPHTLPESRKLWERGWLDDQMSMTKQTRRNYYLKRKHEKAMQND